ncbi:hypothetical protein BH23ACT9_BH23ACT9_23810 [soil metagenome]
MSDQVARRLRRVGHPLPDALVDPHPLRLDAGVPGSADAAAAHRHAVADGADGYVDPASGLFCFTAEYHWNKSECCELGCRHCPWIEADERLAAPGPIGDR